MMRRSSTNPEVDHPASIRVACPACYAPAGEPCTAPTNTARRVVLWFHSARTTLALESLSEGSVGGSE